MKVRNGFVSNSSSSSFCIYGADITNVKLEDILAKCKKLFPKSVAKVNADADEDREEFRIDDLFYETEIGKELEKLGLEYHSINGDCLYLGRSWRKVGDKQTGAQFKSEVKKNVEKIVGKISCDTYEEAWYRANYNGAQPQLIDFMRYL